MNKNMHIKKSYSKVIEDFSNKARKLLSKDLVDILVYGSVARGKANPKSDIDVIVIVKKNVFKNQMKLASLAFDILLDTGEYISVQAMKPRDLKRDTIFMQNVRGEAIHAI